MKTKSSLAAVAAVAVAAWTLGAFAHGGTRTAARGSRANPNAVGIAVHGRWTLQVRSRSGRVVRTYRFHNDLYPGFGSGRIASALLGNDTPGAWEVYMFGPPAQQPCAGGEGCGSIEPGWSGVGHTFDNLVTSTIAGGLRLKGSAVADNDGQITNVWTYLLRCPPSVAPNACDETTQSGYSVFTSRTLPSMVAVLAGQQVLVTVDLTFS